MKINNLKALKVLNRNADPKPQEHPFFCDKFWFLWNEYVESRKEMNRPLTSQQERALLMKLKRAGERDALRSLLYTLEQATVTLVDAPAWYMNKKRKLQYAEI